MSAAGSGAIGPVSVRYAAQIRELLHAQALQRMAAAAEAARASAEVERSARVGLAEKSEESQPVKAKPDPHELSGQPQQARPEKAEPVPAIQPSTGHLVDIQA